MAGVRSGWLRTPFLQLATAVAMIAFVATVGIDVFGGAMPSAALRAAAPAQEPAMEAPAEVAAAGALEAGSVATAAETALAEKTVAEETAVVAAAPMEVLAATPTPGMQAEEYANREAPAVGGAAVPPAPSEVATAAPMRAAAPTVGRECEACGADLVLPTAALQDNVVATAIPEGVAVTQEAVAQAIKPPAEEPAPEARVRRGLPAMRWLEIGLGVITLLLGTVTLWARRRAR
jgi:hypothetical protein